MLAPDGASMTSGLPAGLAGLLEPAAYPHPVEYIRLVETHVSWVLLTGTYAYKIKRPVRYPFVDLRDPQRRAYFCAEEVRLNRRFARDLYLGVSRVTRVDGNARIDGPGPAVEHAVRMRQFEPGQELDRLLETGAVAPADLRSFARSLSEVHAQLPVAAEGEPWGRPDHVAALLRENLEQCVQAAARFHTSTDVESLRQSLEARLGAARSWLLARRASARIRECHGDLHVRNVVRHSGTLVAFDCMEFEPAFRWTDVADEIAFLFMDLEAHARPLHAHAFLDGYLSASGDYDACTGLGLYASHRALVRAKVAALEASMSSDAEALEGLEALHRAYLDTAHCNLAARRPRLVLMHGLSGSGKTWLASAVAPALRAIHLRSDVERKRLAGLPELADSRSQPGAGLYDPTMSARVHARLVECARCVLAGGWTAIVDATFQRRADRALFVALAAQHGIELEIVDCRARDAVLESRVEARRRAGADASEADLAVLERQRAMFEPVREDEGVRIVSIDTSAPDAVETLLRTLEQRG